MLYLPIREVQAGFAHCFQPLTLCAYEARDVQVVDLRNHDILATLDLTPDAPACAWRDDVDGDRVPEGWHLADALQAAGADGVLVPSYAVGATSRDLNLVLWRWNAGSGATVTVIDDFGWLPSPPAKP